MYSFYLKSSLFAIFLRYYWCKSTHFCSNHKESAKLFLHFCAQNVTYVKHIDDYVLPTANTSAAATAATEAAT